MLQCILDSSCRVFVTVPSARLIHLFQKRDYALILIPRSGFRVPNEMSSHTVVEVILQQLTCLAPIIVTKIAAEIPSIFFSVRTLIRYSHIFLVSSVS